MSRIELASIPSLTFYKDSLTTSRRTKPIQQLICEGAPCKLYQPEVVRCVSLPGGWGTDVDWKCEADLPDTLRFGRVEVSCEGWSKPGDPYVLKATAPRPPPPRPQSGGWFPGGMYDSNNYQPPPPYSKDAAQGADANQGWQPGFWTGAAIGGALSHMFNRAPASTTEQEPRPSTYDWERPHSSRPQSSSFGGRRTTPSTRSEDRGEGSSNLGSMRRSTGLGGSKVR
ncbi:hypothetical protein H0H92_011381 [Tricholoma furcatifolium]|nr:hypothetical protein H0H92_011381 [Tricholoma furcatifolium]